MMITYCVFTIGKSNSLLTLKPVKQVLVTLEMAFNLKQIYGINDALDDNKDELNFLAGEDGDGEAGQS